MSRNPLPMRKSSKNVVEYTISDINFIVYTLQHRSSARFPLKTAVLDGNRKSLNAASGVTRRYQNYYFLDSNLLFLIRKYYFPYDSDKTTISLTILLLHSHLSFFSPTARQTQNPLPVRKSSKNVVEYTISDINFIVYTSK